MDNTFAEDQIEYKDISLFAAYDPTIYPKQYQGCGLAIIYRDEEKGYVKYEISNHEYLFRSLLPDLIAYFADDVTSDDLQDLIDNVIEAKRLPDLYHILQLGKTQRFHLSPALGVMKSDIDKLIHMLDTGQPKLSL